MGGISYDVYEKKMKAKDEEIKAKDEEIKNIKSMHNYYRDQYWKEEGKNRENEKQILKFESENSDLQKKLDDHSKKLYDLSNKNDQLQKNEEEIKKLNDNINKYKNNEMRNKKSVDEYKMKIENLTKEYNQQIEQIQNQLKQEKDEKKKKEVEERAKLRKLNYQYTSNLNSIKSKKIKKFLDNFDKNFCSEDFLKINKEKTLNLIFESFKDEKFVASVNFFLNKFTESAKNKIKDFEHLNILIVGPCGVGKTTLINALLKLNLKTGIGAPQTQKIDPHTSNEIPFLRLIDSKGIEKDPSVGVDFTFAEISKYIKEMNDPDSYIHCIWYCWTGTRLEDIEIKLLKKLAKEYTLKDLPVIIVYTNAIKQNEIESAKEYIKSLGIENEFVEILAVEAKIGFGDSATIIPAYGLDKLMELSIEKAKSAVDSACYAGLLKEVKKEIEDTLNTLVEVLEKKLNGKIDIIISEIEKNLDRKNLQTELNKIIVELFYYFFLLSPDIKVDTQNNYEAELKTNDFNLKYRISDISLNKIEEFVTKYMNEFYEIYNRNLNKIVEIYQKDLLQEIETFRMNFIIENGKIFKMSSSLEMEKEIQSFIEINISKVAEITAFQNFIRNLIGPLIIQYASSFKELYQKIMEKNKDKTIKMITISFDKIEQEIKKYNENKKNKKEENEPSSTKNVENDLNMKKALSKEDFKAIMDDYDEFEDEKEETEEKK